MQRINGNSFVTDEPPIRAWAVSPLSGPIQVLAGPMLCHLRVWTEAEWSALPAADRPTHYTHAPGLGWVGAVGLECMN